MLSLIQALQEFLLGLLGESRYALAIANAALVVFTILVYWLLYFVVFRVFKRLSNRVLKEDSQVQPFRIQEQEILSAKEVALILNRTLMGISWFLRLWIIFAFANTVLGLFEWTRDASKSIATFVGGIVGGIWGSFIDYLPDLFTAIVIIAIAHMIIKLFKLVFDGVARQRIKVPGFYPEWSTTSFSLLRLLIIALTIVVVIPRPQA
jgi:hypothetical protein